MNNNLHWSLQSGGPRVILAKMVKKKIHRSSANRLSGKQHDSPDSKMAMSIDEQDSDKIQLLDHSIINMPLNLGLKNVRQILIAMADGGPELKDLLLNECDIIYECRSCRNLFRSLANFVAHKRLYCKNHCCEQMTLYDSDWNLFDQVSENEAKPTINQLKEKVEDHSEEMSQYTKIATNEKMKLNRLRRENTAITTVCKLANKELSCSSSQRVTRSSDPPQFLTLSSNNTHVPSPRAISSADNGNGKRRLETIINMLSNNKKQKTEGQSRTFVLEQHSSRQNNKRPITRNQVLDDLANSNVQFNSNIWIRFSHDLKDSPFLYTCPGCYVKISYLSNAVRHLVTKHALSRYKAKQALYTHQLNLNISKAVSGHAIVEKRTLQASYADQSQKVLKRGKQDQIENQQNPFDKVIKDEDHKETESRLVTEEMRRQLKDGPKEALPARGVTQPENQQLDTALFDTSSDIDSSSGTELNSAQFEPQSLPLPAKMLAKRFSTRERKKKCLDDFHSCSNPSCHKHSRIEQPSMSYSSSEGHASNSGNYLMENQTQSFAQYQSFEVPLSKSSFKKGQLECSSGSSKEASETMSNSFRPAQGLSEADISYHTPSPTVSPCSNSSNSYSKLDSQSKSTHSCPYEASKSLTNKLITKLTLKNHKPTTVESTNNGLYSNARIYEHIPDNGKQC